MKNIYQYLLVLLMIGIASASSVVDTPVIAKIEIRGNQLTKNYIIEREIHHPVGVPFDSTIAMMDRNRIDNLGIFSDVQFYLIPVSKGAVTLIYHVAETWRIFPLPIFIYQEKSGWSLGGMLMIKNFRGRNEYFHLIGAGGQNSFGGIQFNNPWITGDHISLQSHFLINVFDHPFHPFKYRELDGEVTFGRYFGYHWKIWVTASLERRWIEYTDDQPDQKHNYFQSKFLLMYDTRDIYIDPTNGIMIYSEIKPDLGLDNQSPNNTVWEFQASGYKTLISGLKRWVGGVSLYVKRHFGESIPYRVYSVGGLESIRGWQVVDSLTYDEENYRIGLNHYFVSMEVRQTIISKRLTSIGTELGIILVEFIDVGAADDDFFPMFSKTPITGVGAGIRFYIPGNMLFRIDYGIGFYKGQWRNSVCHLGIGHKF